MKKNKLWTKAEISILLFTIKRTDKHFEKTCSTARKKGFGWSKTTASADDKNLEFLVLLERKKSLWQLFTENKTLSRD